MGTTRAPALVPDLAEGLANLSSWLSADGQASAAVEAAQEAIAIFRRLAAEQPDVYLSDLAANLNDAGEALQAASEGVETLLPLFREDPEAVGGFLERLLKTCKSQAKAMGRELDPGLVAAVREACEPGVAG